MIKALIFDFDGLMVDTETPELATWEEIYARHGVRFPVQLWGRIVGGSGAAQFDPLVYLQEHVMEKLDVEALRAEKLRRYQQSLESQPALPGVKDYLAEARRLALKMAVASSSTHAWVEGQLRRLGLIDYFAVIKCREDVRCVKPDPELFLSVLDALGLHPGQAVVFEDSPNGLQAAHAAGIAVVVVPNLVTAQLGVEGAELMLASLADMPLADLLDRFNSGSAGKHAPWPGVQAAPMGGQFPENSGHHRNRRRNQ